MFRRGLKCGRPGGKWRQATEAQQAEIAEFAQTVLDAREQYPDSTIARMYVPRCSPALTAAHEALDVAVERTYVHIGRSSRSYL